MDVLTTCRERRAAILERWHAAIVATYPEQSRAFLADPRDRFGNPVGATLHAGAAALLDGLLDGAPGAVLDQAIAAVVRLRAVQQFTPAQAVGFIFVLKRAIRDEAGAVGEPGLLELFERIDEAALRAFDLYAGCREQLLQLHAREARARVHSLLQRAGIVVEMDDGESGGPPATGIAGAEGGGQ
jgi:hypothetical protein